MRYNLTQAEIGECVSVSKSTISRAISIITPLISAALAAYVPTADELDAEAALITTITPLIPANIRDCNMY